MIPPKQVVFPLSRAIYLFGSIPAVKSIRFDVEATSFFLDLMSTGLWCPVVGNYLV